MNSHTSIADVSILTHRCTYPVIIEGSDVTELFNANVLGQSHQRFVVERDGRFIGILSIETLVSADHHKWSATKVKYIMTPAQKVLAVYPYTDLQDAIDLMLRNNAEDVYVIAGHRLLGIINRHDILTYQSQQAQSLPH